MGNTIDIIKVEEEAVGKDKDDDKIEVKSIIRFASSMITLLINFIRDLIRIF